MFKVSSKSSACVSDLTKIVHNRINLHLQAAWFIDLYICEYLLETQINFFLLIFSSLAHSQYYAAYSLPSRVSHISAYKFLSTTLHHLQSLSTPISAGLLL